MSDGPLPEGLFIGDWEDELGRLRVWAANIGAHQTNQSSLVCACDIITAFFAHSINIQHILMEWWIFEY